MGCEGIVLNKDDTFTVQNILDAYRSAYFSVHSDYPERCVHLNGKWFRIDGKMRDREWVMREVKSLREQALRLEQQESVGSGRGLLMRLIGRLAGGGKSQGDTTKLNGHDGEDETIQSTLQFYSDEQSVPRPQNRTDAHFGAHDTLILKLGDESIAVPRLTTLHLGRGHSTDGPSIDFTPYRGMEMGVSRRHAQIFYLPGEDCLEIMDLGSSNGTFINGYFLDPLQRYRLYDGDTINLGSMVLEVRFTRAYH